MVIAGEYDYWNVSVQNEIENLTRSFESSPFIASSSLYTESWLRAFTGYAERNNMTTDTAESFISTLKEVSKTCYFKHTQDSVD